MHHFYTYMGHSSTSCMARSHTGHVLSNSISEIDSDHGQAFQLESYGGLKQAEFSSNVIARKRAVLTPQKALEIYMYCKNGQRNVPGASFVVSRHFGISPKAVRDIWNRY